VAGPGFEAGTPRFSGPSRNPRFAAMGRHGAPWAESKRFLEIVDHREPPPTAVGRHAEVWWDRGGRRGAQNENEATGDGPA
jgi:hypothetical protein